MPFVYSKGFFYWSAGNERRAFASDGDIARELRENARIKKNKC